VVGSTGEPLPAADLVRAIGRAATDDEVCRLVAERAAELNPTAVVLVSLFDPERHVLRPRALHGLGTLASRVVDLIGSDPMRLAARVSDITPAERELYVCGRMVRLPYGLHSVAARRVPAPVVDAIAALLGLGAFYGVGFALHGHPYGGLMVAPRRGAPLVGASELELVVAFAGAVIQRMHADAARADATGRLAGGVAHEFNNLLCVVLGNLALALDVPDVPEEARELVHDAVVGAERAADLTRRLLAFGRRQPIAPQVVAIDDALADARLALEQAALVGGAALRVDRGAPGARARLDVKQLQDVLAAVVRELAEWGGPSPEVVLTTAARSLDGDASAALGLPPGDFVELLACRAGAPPDPADAEARTSPFLGAVEAHGLAIAAADGALRQNGGALLLERAPGGATCVRMVWPRASSDAEVAARSPSRRGGRPARVLLVEDDAEVRRTLARLLEGAGHAVIACEDAASAASAARERIVDVVLADVFVASQSGPAIARDLDRIQPGVPVLFVSGTPRDELDRAGTLPAGARCLPKPVGRAELVAAIDAALAAASGRAPAAPVPGEPARPYP
jgi:CheY-like chemotaxis protein